MSTTIFCQRAKMGSTTYFIGKMKATDLMKIAFASQLPNWKSMTIDERIQREIAETRVRTEIVPYLQEDPDRFFGALIVDIYRGWDNVAFEPLGGMIKGLPAAYATQTRDAGFLTFPGDEYLVALDGQHRLKAIRLAMYGDGKIQPMPELAEDEVTVIFVKHESDQKIRTIFNKVNRYAKQTSRSDNIITAEDDACAIVARRLIRADAGVLKPDQVNWKANALSARSDQFTTMSTVYETVQVILGDRPELKNKAKLRPSEEALDEYFHAAYEAWDAVLTGMEAFEDLSPPVVKRQREGNLLFRPIGQVALFKGLQHARNLAHLDLTKAVQRLNTRVDWSSSADMWLHVLVKPDGGMIAREENKDLAGELIAYLIAMEGLPKGFVQQLAAKFADKRGGNLKGREPSEVLPNPKNL